MIRKSPFILFVLLTFICYSCYKSQDFQLGTLKASGDYQGGFAFAIGSGKITFKDFQFPDTSILPWWKRTSFLPYSSSVLFDALGLVGNLNHVTSFTLRMITLNGFPIGGDVQMYFVSENGAILDSILANQQIEVVNASVVKAQTGNLIQVGYAITDITLNQNEILLMRNVKKIFITGALNARNADSTLFKFYPRYNIEFKLSAKVGTDYRFN